MCFKIWSSDERKEKFKEKRSLGNFFEVPSETAALTAAQLS